MHILAIVHAVYFLFGSFLSFFFFREYLKNRTDSPLYESTLYPVTGRNFHITGILFHILNEENP